MVGEVSVQESNESGRKKAKQTARMVQRGNRNNAMEFTHVAVVPWFMDNRMVAQRAVDKLISLGAAADELRVEWLAS